MSRRRKKLDPSRLRTVAACRDLQHAWRPHDGGRRGKGWFRVLECPRCGTHVEQELDRFGQVTSRRYRYPEGYLVKGGPLTKEERGAIRLIGLDDS